MLRFRRGSQLARVLSVFLTFAISGLIHKLVDATGGVPYTDNSALVSFSMQAVGITLEDLVQQVHYRSASKTSAATPQLVGYTVRGNSHSEPPKVWHKTVGYIWVFAWLVWVTAPYSYSKTRNPVDPVFPFSVTQTLMARLS